MHPFVETASESELRFIASLDRGSDQERHYARLHDLIHQRKGELHEDDAWFPYEVIELGSHNLQPGHHREFVISTLLVIHAVKAGFDTWTCLEDKRADRRADYAALPPELRLLVDQEYLT